MATLKAKRWALKLIKGSGEEGAPMGWMRTCVPWKGVTETDLELAISELQEEGVIERRQPYGRWFLVANPEPT